MSKKAGRSKNTARAAKAKPPRKTAFVPKFIYSTVFAGVIPLCAIECGPTGLPTDAIQVDAVVGVAADLASVADNGFVFLADLGFSVALDLTQVPLDDFLGVAVDLALPPGDDIGFSVAAPFDSAFSVAADLALPPDLAVNPDLTKPPLDLTVAGDLTRPPDLSARDAALDGPRDAAADGPDARPPADAAMDAAHDLLAVADAFRPDLLKRGG